MTNLKLPEDFETYPEARKNAFLKMKENVHPLLAEILDLNLSFLASEFVKEVEAKNKHRFI